MGISYCFFDEIFWCFVDFKMLKEKIVEEFGISVEKVEYVEGFVRRSEYKWRFFVGLEF